MMSPFCELGIWKGHIFNHDFCYSFSFLHPSFFRRKREKGKRITKVMVKSYAFLLDPILWVEHLDTLKESYFYIKYWAYGLMFLCPLCLQICTFNMTSSRVKGRVFWYLQILLVHHCIAGVYIIKTTALLRIKID